MRHARSPSSRIRRPPPPRPSVNSHIAVDCGSRLDEVRNQHDPTGSRLARPGPGTDSTSSTRSTSVPLGTSAAITGFLSAFRRLMRGGFTYPLDGGPVRVPGGEYFVLGDNRPVSADSHLGWFVPTGDMLGQAMPLPAIFPSLPILATA